MTLKKLAQAGTHSLWYQLFQGEVPRTCLRFRGAKEGDYHWAQDLDYMNAYFPVPEGVRGRAVSLVIDADGGGMTLRYPGPGGEEEQGEVVEVRGEFSGVVAPDDCSWVIDEDEAGRRCVCLSLRKRVREASESTWWPRFFKAEEAVAPPEELAALRTAQAAVRAERDALDREVLGGALLSWIEGGGEDGVEDGGQEQEGGQKGEEP